MLDRFDFFVMYCISLLLQAKEALLAHSTVLQAKDEEIQALKEEVCWTIFFIYCLNRTEKGLEKDIFADFSKASNRPSSRWSDWTTFLINKVL